MRRAEHHIRQAVGGSHNVRDGESLARIYEAAHTQERGGGSGVCVCVWARVCVYVCVCARACVCICLRQWLAAATSTMGKVWRAPCMPITCIGRIICSLHGSLQSKHDWIAHSLVQDWDESHNTCVEGIRVLLLREQQHVVLWFYTQPTGPTAGHVGVCSCV